MRDRPLAEPRMVDWYDEPNSLDRMVVEYATTGQGGPVVSLARIKAVDTLADKAAAKRKASDELLDSLLDLLLMPDHFRVYGTPILRGQLYDHGDA